MRAKLVQLTFPLLIRMLSKDVVEWTNDLVHTLDITNASVRLAIDEEQSLHHLYTHTHTVKGGGVEGVASPPSEPPPPP